MWVVCWSPRWSPQDALPWQVSCKCFNVLLIFLLSYDMIWLVCYAIIQLYTIAIITWLDPPQPPQPFHLFFDLPMPWIGMMMMMVRISVVCGAFTHGGFTYRYILRISVIIIIMLRLMILSFMRIIAMVMLNANVDAMALWWWWWWLWRWWRW